jgi:hypothetical protein
MTQRKTNQTPSWQRTIQIGAAAGIALTVAYSSLFAFYAVCRSSLTIAATMSLDSNLFGTLAANATSIGLASTVTALALSPLTALLGIGTASMLKWLNALFNLHNSLPRTMFFGLASALTFVLAIEFVGQWLLGRSLNSLGLETYLFWFGLPGLVHIVAGVIGAWYFHHSIVNIPTVKTGVHYGSQRAYTRTS